MKQARGSILLAMASLWAFGSAPATAQSNPHLRILSLTGSASGDEGDGFAWAAVVEGASGPVLYSWDFGDGTAPMTVFDTATMNHRYADDDTYSLTLTVEGVYGSDRQSLEVVVEPARPKIRLLVAERTGDGDSFHFASEVADPGDDDLELSWDFGDGSPPQTGSLEDLAEVEHTYDKDGRFTVTLTARDKDDNLETSVARKVAIGNTIDVTVSGAVNASIQTGQGPASLCVVPLGEGGCGFHFQYWDDKNQTYLFLQNYANPIVEPRDYPMVAADKRRLKPGTPIAEATGIVSAGMRSEDYFRVQEFLKVTECDPKKMPGSFSSAMSALTGGGTKGMGKNLLKSLPGGGLFGGGGSGGAPTGGGWAARSGALRITRIDQNRVEGTVESEMVGGKGRSQSTVFVEGSFSAEFEEHTQPFLEMCNLGPFRVAERSPAPEAENVFFGEPDIRVGFTRPLDPASVNGESVRLEAKNDEGEYRLVPTRKLLDSETSRIHLVPWIQLESARDHRIIVEGGPDGVRSRGGEQLDDEDQWEMTTMVDLYRPLPGDGDAVALRLPHSLYDQDDSRSYNAPGPVYAVLTSGNTARARRFAMAKGGGDWVGENSQKVFQKVNCDTYQVTRNEPLVPKKTTAFRVYLRWREKSDVEKVKVDTVRFLANGKSALSMSGYGHLPDFFRHPDTDWPKKDHDVRMALNTANYFGWEADRSIHTITAEVDLKDSNGKIHTFKGACPVGHWDPAPVGPLPSGEAMPQTPVSAYKLRATAYTLPVIPTWNPPVPQLTDDVKKFFSGSMEFLIQNYPISEWEADIVEVIETNSPAKTGPKRIRLLEANLKEQGLSAPDPPRAMMLRLQRTLEDLGRLNDADIHVGIYPDGLDKWKSGDEEGQFGYNYSGKNDGEFINICRASGKTSGCIMRIVLDQEKGRKNGSTTLAHEIGHAFGLEHFSVADTCETNGFRLWLGGDGGWNKSTKEGNAEDEKTLYPVMVHGAGPFPTQWFICDQSYQKLRMCMGYLFGGTGSFPPECQ